MEHADDNPIVAHNPVEIASFYFQENEKTGLMHWQHMDRERMRVLFTDLLSRMPKGSQTMRNRVEAWLA